MPSEAEVGIEPSGGITFTGPFRTERKVKVRLSNPTDHRITFKTKHSQQNRLSRLSSKPGFGFIEPYGNFCITLYCKPFDSTYLSKRDRFTILLTETPENTKETRPVRVWSNTMSAAGTTIIRRHVMFVTYLEQSTAAGQEDKIQPLKPTGDAERKRREEEKKAEAERKQKEKENEKKIRRERQKKQKK